MKRYVIVGDIHGMLPELDQLLTLVELHRDDTLVLVGDLLDKGPDSPGVVKLLRSLRGEGYGIVLVKGNHEEKHERYRRAMLKSGGRLPNMKGVEEMAEITAALSEEDITFLESAVMYYRIPEHDSVVVHAGVLPGTETLESEDPKMLRVRYVTGQRKVLLTIEVDASDNEGDEPNVGDPVHVQKHWDARVTKKVIREKGEFILLGAETEDDPYWANAYDGRFGHVYFGHEPFSAHPEPKEYWHATGLDLGCVFGGRLACAVLVPGSEPRFYSVPASGTFCKSKEE